MHKIYINTVNNKLNKRTTMLAIEHPLERTVRNILLALVAILLCGYVYFVGASVLNIMARKEADARASSLASAAASMERDYFAIQQSVNPSLAPELGLSALPAENYVYRPGGTALATMANNAI